MIEIEEADIVSLILHGDQMDYDIMDLQGQWNERSAEIVHQWRAMVKSLCEKYPNLNKLIRS